MKDNLKILMAMDGSDQSFDAVRYISGIFPSHKTRVVLFCVNTVVPEAFLDLSREAVFRSRVAEISAWAVQMKKNINDFMDRARAILIDSGFSSGNVTIKVQVKQQGIARDILTESRDRYDALVVGRKGVSKLKDVVMGSVANKLLGKMSHAPIIVVGGKPDPGKVLIGFDGSKGAMKAVDCAGSLANSSLCIFDLCHVIRPLEIQMGVKSLFNPNVEDEWIESNIKEIKPIMDEAADHLMRYGVPDNHISKTILKRESSRAEAMVRKAKNDNYGSIVVGRRGISVVEEFFLGRVSTKVIQMANKMAVWVV
ncbi:conserved hypothetical protein [uncultured Desulfobacterium sp.]|uniref:UspA domain-containing protein n=1 Tax=uncultured Desulfobacterium sp. TaxID=201089 RepID=A0A445MRW6_9BACT|nr:conserved hypothetical protein [uncultured Desulfobacterium sp.]